MDSNILKIALLPLDIAWGDIDENLVATASMLAAVEADTDLVVLPEMFSTGFITEPSLLAPIDEERTRRTLDDVRRWTKYFGFAICGSLLACDVNKYYNRGFFIEPSGDETYYDKRHLFSMGGEARTYTPGSSPSPVVRYRGCNIKMLICYDLRFPVWSRNVGNAYDLLIYPANWPDARFEPWNALLRARAIENQAYVAGCNRVGTDDFGTYAEGHSFVYNDWGQSVGSPGAHGIIYATVDLEALRRHRSKFPVWRDADPFTLDI